MTLKSELHLLKHPFYQAWMNGDLTQTTLKDYAEQYFHHVEAFPKYLKTALKHLDGKTAWSMDAKQILKENLEEEDGTRYGTSHPTLWANFAQGMGATKESLTQTQPRIGIQNVVGSFSKAAETSLPQALGSLFAYESQVPEVATSKIEGLKNVYGVTDPRTLAFFEVHRVADVEHRESLLKIIDGLSPSEKAEAQIAADTACQALWDFLTDVCHHNGIACA